MSSDMTALPPPSGSANDFRLPLVPSRRAVAASLRTRDALVEEAIAARRRFDHTRFVSALTALTCAPALRRVEPVAELASCAYGIEACELVATIAGRWVHAARPGAADRRQVAEALGPKLQALRVCGSAMAALLVLDPRPRHWLWFARRGRVPPLFAFELVRVEIARSPELLAALFHAGLVSSTAAAWAEAARSIPWDGRCTCADCARSA